MSLWSAVQNAISEATGLDFVIESRERVTGGDINQSYRISGQRQGCFKHTYFVKINHASRIELFHAEINGLKALAESNSFKIPQVITIGKTQSSSFLVLEFLELASKEDIKTFAKNLAQMHQSTHSNFGFVKDNFIGLTAQPNQWSSEWIDFYSEQRIGYQLELLTQKSVATKFLNKVKILQQNIPEFFQDYSPKPALVHGDLWSGNYAFDENELPVIFDPACYYADHEVDLAMLELFGNPGNEFFETYHQYYPIDSGYQRRKNLYNLYHILNHINLFGESYLQQAESMLSILLRK